MAESSATTVETAGNAAAEQKRRTVRLAFFPPVGVVGLVPIEAHSPARPMFHNSNMSSVSGISSGRTTRKPSQWASVWYQIDLGS